MLEKKNKRLALLLVVLICATIGLYWLSGDNGNFAVDKNIFKDYDLQKVDQVIMESSDDTVKIKATGSRWTVNDHFAADPAMIDVLFATIQQAEPRRPVAALQQDSMAVVLRRTGTKVSLFASGEQLETFVAGGNKSKTQAYFLDVAKGKSYIVTIPGYRVYVSGIFELEESGWRDKYVFGFNWRNFQKLDLKFANKPSEDFVVAMKGKYFGVQGLVEVDTTRLNDFLDNISLLTVAKYLPANDRLDSLAGVSPLVTIVVADVASKEYRLQLYPPLTDTRQFLGRINGSQWALFPEKAVAEIIRPRSFFGK